MKSQSSSHICSVKPRQSGNQNLKKKFATCFWYLRATWSTSNPNYVTPHSDLAPGSKVHVFMWGRDELQLQARGVNTLPYDRSKCMRTQPHAATQTHTLIWPSEGSKPEQTAVWRQQPLRLHPWSERLNLPATTQPTAWASHHWTYCFISSADLLFLNNRDSTVSNARPVSVASVGPPRRPHRPLNQLTRAETGLTSHLARSKSAASGD